MRSEIFTCKWWRQWSKFMKDLETTKPWKTFGRSSVCLVFKRLLAMTFWIRILAFCVGKMFVKLAFSLCISLLGALRYIRRTQKCRGQNDSWLVFPCLINFDYSMSSSLLWCWPLWYQNFRTFFREIHFTTNFVKMISRKFWEEGIWQKNMIFKFRSRVFQSLSCVGKWIWVHKIFAVRARDAFTLVIFLS